MISDFTSIDMDELNERLNEARSRSFNLFQKYLSEPSISNIQTQENSMKAVIGKWLIWIGCLMNPKQKQSLNQIRLALLANHNCLMTDRPDLVNKLPPSVVFWITDFSREIKLVDALLNNDSDHECTGRSNDLLNEQT